MKILEKEQNQTVHLSEPLLTHEWSTKQPSQRRTEPKLKLALCKPWRASISRQTEPRAKCVSGCTQRADKFIRHSVPWPGKLGMKTQGSQKYINKIQLRYVQYE